VARFTQANRSLQVTTPLGPDDLLLEKLNGSEAVSEPFRFRLDMLAEKPVEFDKLIGQPVTVSVTPATGSSRVINGIFSRLTQGNSVVGTLGKNTFIRYRAELVPALWLLGRRTQSRVFQQMSVIDILKQVLTTDWQLDVHINTVGTYHPRNYCVQYAETDLAFVSRLMEHEGLFYYFTHTKSAHTMVITDSSPTGGTELTPSSVYYSPAPEGVRDTPRIWDFEKTQELRSCKHTIWDYCFQLPSNDLSANSTIVDQVKVGSVSHRLNLQRTVGGTDMLEVQDSAAGFAHWSDGINPSGGEQAAELSQIFENNARLAKVLTDMEAVEAIVCRGIGDCASFLPGGFFTLQGHFDASDAFFLTRVEHQASMEGVYTTNAEKELEYRNEFQAVPKALRYRPSKVTPRPRVSGSLKGLVIGPVADQAYCDKYGRIKVRFAWGTGTKASAGDSCWLRVGQPWAGQTWGSVTLPRVGQEVAVNFYHGDPDQPYVSVSHYNAAQMPPYNLPSEWRQSGQVSSSGNSVEQYHEIRLDDTPGAELLLLHSEKDMSTNAENNHAHSVANAHSIQVGNSMSVKAGPKSTGGVSGNPPGSGSGGGADTVEHMGIDWTVDNETTYNWGNQALIIRGSGSTVTFGAQDFVVLGAYTTAVAGLNTTTFLGGNIAVTLGANIAYTAPFNIAITQGWILTVDTAGHFEFHNGFHLRNTNGFEDKTVQGDSTYTVTGARSLVTTGLFTNTANGAMTTTVTGNSTETVNGVLTSTANGNRSVITTGTRNDTTTLAHVITSPASLTLQVGGSSIEITPASITLTCGGTVLALTDGDVTLTSAAISLLGGGGASSLQLGPDAVTLLSTETIIGGAEISIGA
jgi:type VI secretion system secreted protein VgrG